MDILVSYLIVLYYNNNHYYILYNNYIVTSIYLNLISETAIYFEIIFNLYNHYNNVLL